MTSLSAFLDGGKPVAVPFASSVVERKAGSLRAVVVILQLPIGARTAIDFHGAEIRRWLSSAHVSAFSLGSKLVLISAASGINKRLAHFLVSVKIPFHDG